jgi:predicted nucleotidyltransferase
MTRDEAITKLRSHAGAIKALGATSLYLFGSTVRNEADADSDIDLFLDYDPRGRFNALDLVATKRLLEERLGVEVDLTTRKGLHPLIRKKIEAEATQVF